MHCAAHGIALQAYEPLASDRGASSLITGNLTNSIGKKHGKTGAQVALRVDQIEQHSRVRVARLLQQRSYLTDLARGLRADTDTDADADELP